jgi:DNA-directed RNA polymerase subunit RPC12/RpoP
MNENEYKKSFNKVLKDHPFANFTLSSIHENVLNVYEACDKADEYDKREKFGTYLIIRNKGIGTRGGGKSVRCGNCFNPVNIPTITTNVSRVYCQYCGYRLNIKYKVINEKAGNTVKTSFLDEVEL